MNITREKEGEMQCFLKKEDKKNLIDVENVETTDEKC